MAEALNAPTLSLPISGGRPALCVLGPQISFQLGYFLHQPLLDSTSLCPCRATGFSAFVPLRDSISLPFYELTGILPDLA